MTANKKPQSLKIRNSTAEFLMFTADNHQDGIEVRFQDETVWLSQRKISYRDFLDNCEGWLSISRNPQIFLHNIFPFFVHIQKTYTKNHQILCKINESIRNNPIHGSPPQRNILLLLHQREIVLGELTTSTIKRYLIV